MKFHMSEFSDFWDKVVVKNFPNAKLKYKDQSLFMKFLSVILFFNKAFMSRFITVIGNTVYFPSSKWLCDNYSVAVLILAHETVHMFDREQKKKWGIDWYSIGYLSPQIWGLFSLLAFLGFANLYFLFFLVFLLCVFPWGSPWRTEIELNGYAMTMYFHSRMSKTEYYTIEEAKYYSWYFTSKAYYWMCRNENYVVSELVKRSERLHVVHPAFLEVSKWLDSQSSA